MAVRLRLKRTGRKNRPFYRIGAFHQTTRRDGRPVEDLGWYDPLVKDRDKSFEINEERAKYWLSVGAQPSDAVRKLFEISGALEARPVKVKDPKVHVVDEAAQAADAEEDEAVIEVEATGAAVVETLNEIAETKDDAEASAEGDVEVDESLLDEVTDAVEDVVGEITADDDEVESKEESS